MKNRIKELRKDRGLTLKQLSEKVGISNQGLSFYERGKRNPKMKNWVQLADFFGVTVEYLQGYGVSQREFIDFLIQFIYKDIDLIRRSNNPETSDLSDTLIEYVPAVRELFYSEKAVPIKLGENTDLDNDLRQHLKYSLVLVSDYDFLANLNHDIISDLENIDKISAFDTIIYINESIKNKQLSVIDGDFSPFNFDSYKHEIKDIEAAVNALENDPDNIRLLGKLFALSRSFASKVLLLYNFSLHNMDDNSNNHPTD